MKILVISKEAWRDEQNGGNVLTNMFSHFLVQSLLRYIAMNRNPTMLFAEIIIR